MVAKSVKHMAVSPCRCLPTYSTSLPAEYRCIKFDSAIANSVAESLTSLHESRI